MINLFFHNFLISKSILIQFLNQFLWVLFCCCTMYKTEGLQMLSYICYTYIDSGVVRVLILSSKKPTFRIRKANRRRTSVVYRSNSGDDENATYHRWRISTGVKWKIKFFRILSQTFPVKRFQSGFVTCSPASVSTVYHFQTYVQAFSFISVTRAPRQGDSSERPYRIPITLLHINRVRRERRSRTDKSRGDARRVFAGAYCRRTEVCV